MGHVDVRRMREWFTDHLWYEDPRARSGDRMLPYRPNRAHDALFGTRAAALEPVCYIPFKSRQVAHSSFWLDHTLATAILHPGTSIGWFAPEAVLKRLEPKWRRIVKSVVGEPRLKFTEAIKVPNPETGWPGIDSHRDELIVLANGSRISWTQAGDTRYKASQAGIGETLHLAVLSEFGHWAYGHEAWGALAPAVKRARGTIVIDSTPPDGPGKGAKYMEIAHKALRGGDRWMETLHLPWWFVPEFRSVTPATDYTEEERMLEAKHGLDAYQIAWRRIESQSRRFQRWYVESPAAALSPTAAVAFDAEVVDELLQARLDGEWPDPVPAAAVKAAFGDVDPLCFRSCFAAGFPVEPYDEGYVRVWELPRREDSSSATRKPRVGVDPSEGVQGGDPIAVTVLNEDGVLAATAKLWVAPTRAAGIIQALAEAYGADVQLEKTSVWDTIRRSLRFAIPEAEAQAYGAHHTVCRPLDSGRHRISVMPGQRKTDRVAASREYVDARYPVRDPDILDEIIQRDPTTGKAASKDGDDDLLDALGVARHARQQAVYSPGTTSTAPRYGRREPRKRPLPWRRG